MLGGNEHPPHILRVLYPCPSLNLWRDRHQRIRGRQGVRAAYGNSWPLPFLPFARLNSPAGLLLPVACQRDRLGAGQRDGGRCFAQAGVPALVAPEAVAPIAAAQQRPAGPTGAEVREHGVHGAAGKGRAATRAAAEHGQAAALAGDELVTALATPAVPARGAAAADPGASTAPAPAAATVAQQPAITASRSSATRMHVARGTPCSRSGVVPAAGICPLFRFAAAEGPRYDDTIRGRGSTDPTKRYIAATARQPAIYACEEEVGFWPISAAACVAKPNRASRHGQRCRD